MSRILLNIMTGGERKSQTDFNNMITKSLEGFRDVIGRFGNWLNDATGGGKKKPMTAKEVKMSKAKNERDAWKNIMFD